VTESRTPSVQAGRFVCELIFVILFRSNGNSFAKQERWGEGGRVYARDELPDLLADEIPPPSCFGFSWWILKREVEITKYVASNFLHHQPGASVPKRNALVFSRRPARLFHAVQRASGTTCRFRSPFTPKARSC